MKSRSKFLILSASLILSLAAAGQSAPEPSQGQAASATAEKQVRESGTHYVEEAMKPFIQSGECPGAISILYRDGVHAGLGSYSLGLWVAGNVFGHGGAWDTQATVNWKRRHLTIWIVQQLGQRNQFSWKKPLSKAKEQFFSEKNEAESAADAYTGRTK